MKRIFAAVVAIFVGANLAACTMSDIEDIIDVIGEPTTTPTIIPEPPVEEPGGTDVEEPVTTEGTALAVLDTIEVKGRAPKTGYDRGEFGSGWSDPDRNGCDARNDILQRDLIDIEFRDGGYCVVQTGVLIDPYTGVSIDFLRGQGTSSMVQIDHVVALSDAWQKGAQQLSYEDRVAFANDPLNLLAVSGSANAQKSDGDAATWLPANRGFRCQYVATQIAVKAKYGLWVTQAEREAMVRVLDTCPGQIVPVY